MAAPSRRRSAGVNLGPLPVSNLVVLEVGLAVGLVLLAISMSLKYVAIGVLAVALLIAFLRWRGKWFTQWAGLTLRYTFRSHDRVATPLPPSSLETLAAEEDAVTGPDDARVNLLRLAVPDLVVAHGVDHERQQVGLAWNDGTWTAVLLVEPAPDLITQAGGAPSLPLSALAPCLEDRGVVLDSIQMIWHCYPGSAALPSDSPALSSYMEVLGPLPAAARRTTWVAIRLDPRRCPAAIRERGGGVVGAHRALIGALSRVRNALESQGVPTRPLDPDELLRAGISAAELTAVAGSPGKVSLQERWTGVTAAGIGHASYAISGWPKGKISSSLNALTSVRALSATVAMSISPASDEGKIGLRGVVRLSARNPRELEAADQRLQSLSERLDVSLTPLRGLQISAFAATLPIGGTA
ncbi:type VII secretion protein EccE [Amycolatopsis sp. H20-H5]|uniref:type VII secretion protein EccE n=1 Tax=Amycolatopsis sp. H20-H5 TaxID=3046309 RepID=UPI002DBA846A|nr:type VII secretion protein EccE [Amycolatopsis sp. H20-H5]MEC3979122.1 type VII secretion protein EccE [Amycolatopsis sp. H20-H5]